MTESPINISEIEWLSYPESDEVLSPEQALIALVQEKETFGYCISQTSPSGENRVLLAGVWHRVE